MLKGAVAGTLPTGPWTDGEPPAATIANPWRILVDPMPLVPFSVKMIQIQQGLSLKGGGGGETVR